MSDVNILLHPPSYTGRLIDMRNSHIISAFMININENLLADEDNWVAILEPTLCQDTAAVECLARLLFRIKKAIDSGPEGAMKASETLLNGIELTYLHTAAHKAALNLYVLSLEGTLKPQDEPLNLINAALERGEAAHGAASLKGQR
ncbi:MAG: hypothetical protein WCB68_01685 [Pyrinomonadaceae bacterium]